MKKNWQLFKKEFMTAARETPRIYFALFVGAFRGIRTEIHALNRSKKT